MKADHFRATGKTLMRLTGSGPGLRVTLQFSRYVVPAQAGTQRLPAIERSKAMDSGLRRDDGGSSARL